VRCNNTIIPLEPASQREDGVSDEGVTASY